MLYFCRQNRQFMERNKKLVIAIIALIVIIAGISFIAFNEFRKNKEMAAVFAVEKEEMENEYSTFATQYDELQIQINNDSLREKLESEKLKTQRLLEELRQVKTTDAAEIIRLKKELKTVRAVLRTYVIQIDSLNRLNTALMNEVSLAAQLDATNISALPLNKRGKKARKVKDVKQIAISFTLAKNITAETGNRTLYIRIAKPDNEILSKDNATFHFEDRDITYSIKKYIEYTGEEQDITVYWDVEEFLPSGTYTVYIFAEGNMIGQNSFNMK